MDLKLNDEQLNAIVSASIVQSLSEANKKELIENAIKALLEKDVGNKYDKRSQLQVAFDNAVVRIADKMVEELLAADASFIAEIKTLFAASVERFFSEERRQKTIEALSDALRKVVTGDRY